MEKQIVIPLGNRVRTTRNEVSSVQWHRWTLNLSSQTQKGKYCMTPLLRGVQHRKTTKWGGNWGVTATGYRLFGGMKSLEIHCGDGDSGLSMHLMRLSCTLTVVKMMYLYFCGVYKLQGTAPKLCREDVKSVICFFMTFPSRGSIVYVLTSAISK